MIVLLQGYNLANKLGHSIIKRIPSLFTFKIDDIQLTELSGVLIIVYYDYIKSNIVVFFFKDDENLKHFFLITFLKVKASLKLESLKKNIPQLTQVSFAHGFYKKLINL